LRLAGEGLCPVKLVGIEIDVGVEVAHVAKVGALARLSRAPGSYRLSFVERNGR
jgi:hypothetical protein